MKPVNSVQFETVIVNVPEWFDGADMSLAQMMLDYFDDFMTDFEWHGHITGAVLADEPVLWFTFEERSDALSFVEMLRDAWTFWRKPPLEG